MRYMLLIYDNEKEGAKTEQEEFPLWMKYTEELTASGKMLGGEALKPVATATTVNVKDGKVIQTDGPFAETKEQLGGFYMIEAKDLDEAVHWASKIPVVHRGRVEVRPILEFEEM